MPVRVLVADAHPIIRYGIRYLIAQEPDIEVVGEAREGSEVLPKIQKLKPDVVLVDHAMGGVDLAKIVQPSTEIKASPAVIVFTDRRDPLLVRDMVYSTYLGGSGDDEGTAMAIGPGGLVHVTGLTNSADFPTLNAYDSSFGGGTCGDKPCADVFVAVVDPSANGAASLIYSTYLGGNKYETGKAIAVDENGHAYVAGYTSSNDFPTRNPYQASRAGSSDAFVVKLDAGLSGDASLLYGTFLGGSGSDYAYGLALNGVDRVYLTGATLSSDFPLANAFDGSFGGGTCGAGACMDAFAAQLDLGSNSLVYSTYLGGSGEERGEGIAVDGQGSAYLTGYTKSDDFPLADPLQASMGGEGCGAPPCPDAYVVKLNAAGDSLVYSTYLGGSGEDYGNAIALGSAGSVYLTGYSLSADFPTTPGAYATSPAGGSDAFVVKISEPPSGMSPEYNWRFEYDGLYRLVYACSAWDAGGERLPGGQL